jgi:4-hydroxy-tetrahydrodipicolinate synthase
MSTDTIISGAYPAAVTPFNAKGQVDDVGLAKLLAWFRAAGCDGVVLAGTNGEGPSLSAIEKRDLAKAAVRLSDGLSVILGIATSSLEEAVWSARQAKESGARAVLVMPPSYFREASEEGIALWFEALFDRSPADVIVYNFPKRTGVPLSSRLMGRLAQHERMIGLKDSSGEAANISEYAHALRGSGRSLFMGDETRLIEALQAGWSGTISGASNVIPQWISQIVHEWPTNPESAEAKFELIRPTLKALRTSPQPAANKAILHRLGVLPDPRPRLPLLPIAEADIPEISI